MQEPACGHPVFYSFSIVDPKGSETSLSSSMPDFLSKTDNERTFTVLTSNSDYIGNYKIRIQATMANKYFALPPLDPDTLDIDLSIVAQYIDESSDYGSLEDQSLSLYDGLEYSIGSKISSCPENT